MSKPMMMERGTQRLEETPLEISSRKAAGFEDLERKLPKRWSNFDVLGLDRVTSLLGGVNPFSKPANPKEHRVWLLDNIAYRPIHSYPHRTQPWQAEFTAAYFAKSDKDLAEAVATIADAIGLDSRVGTNKATTDLITERIKPFFDVIASARTISIKLSSSSKTLQLGPSKPNGISNDIEVAGDGAAGTVATATTTEDFGRMGQSKTYFVEPTGWTVICDIDDTIKYTGTSDPKLVLQNTFASHPTAVPGMPQLLSNLEAKLGNSSYFYLSASPYNLYPFLHAFINANYPAGPLILRENSWQELGGILKLLTQGVQAYKVDRLSKIHDWLPKRSIICFGDSTQSDPEAYAEAYRKYPGWIKGIFIRKVVDLPHMTEKNKNERFEKAFEKVKKEDWMVYERPEECEAVLAKLAASGVGK